VSQTTYVQTVEVAATVPVTVPGGPRRDPNLRNAVLYMAIVSGKRDRVGQITEFMWQSCRQYDSALY